MPRLRLDELPIVHLLRIRQYLSFVQRKVLSSELFVIHMILFALELNFSPEARFFSPAKEAGNNDLVIKSGI